MMMKKVRVEWSPLGVIGAIVPWNYPFHNVFNPVSAALFTGNSIVIKVSEYVNSLYRAYIVCLYVCMFVCLEGYLSMLVLPCCITTVALGSPSLLPSCSIITNNKYYCT